MDEDEEWRLFTGKCLDEDKVSPAMRSGSPAPVDPMTWERAQSMLSARLGHARQKHPDYARGSYAAYQVIVDEVLELRHAVGHESRERQVDEALDVAATAMRFVMGEHL